MGIIAFPKKDNSYDEKLVLWTIRAMEKMSKIGRVKKCELFITEEGLKTIENFEPDLNDVPNAIEYLKREGAIEL
jgi:hypothetical protein